MGRGSQPYGLSLLFAPGTRPDGAGIRALSANGGVFAVSHDGGTTSNAETARNGAATPNGPASGNQAGQNHPSAADSLGDLPEMPEWLELLANGLTFDITGLAPGRAAKSPECGHKFDLDPAFDPAGYEALCLCPGPHLAGGERMMPVVRAMVGLAASLCALPDLVAVAWHPARSWIGPRYFTSIIGNWLEGGVFPGLGLVGLNTVADGGMQSEGVAFFTGQELRIEPELTDDRAGAAKIAIRLIDYIVANGALDQSAEVTGPGGRLLRIEPSSNQRFIRVWSAS